MRRTFAGYFVALLGAALPACSFLLDNDDAAAPPPVDVESDGSVAPDARRDSTTPVTDAPTTDGEAGPKTNSCGALLFGTEIPITNGDFELGCANGMVIAAANAAEVTDTVSSGTLACRVCGNIETDPDAYFSLGPQVATAVEAGDVIELVACVRSAPGRTVATNVRGFLWSDSDGTFGAPVTLSASYVPLRISWTVPKPRPSFQGLVTASQVVDACFVVDDVRIFKVK